MLIVLHRRIDNSILSIFLSCQKPQIPIWPFTWLKHPYSHLISKHLTCSRNQRLWNWEPCDLPCFMLDCLYNLWWSHLWLNHPLVCPFKCQCLLTVKQHFHKDILFLWCKTFSNNQLFQSLFGES